MLRVLLTPVKKLSRASVSLNHDSCGLTNAKVMTLSLGASELGVAIEMVIPPQQDARMLSAARLLGLVV